MGKVEKFIEPSGIRNGAKPIYYYINDKGCFICESHRKDRDGYAKLKRKNKEWKAHRYSYTISKGDIPEGLMVRHLCGNKSCINPEHLIVGTAKQNYDDWLATNQQKKKMHRLPEEVKAEIGLSKNTIPELAIGYDVSHKTIINIRKKYRPKEQMKRAPNKASIPSNKTRKKIKASSK